MSQPRPIVVSLLFLILACHCRVWGEPAAPAKNAPGQGSLPLIGYPSLTPSQRQARISPAQVEASRRFSDALLRGEGLMKSNMAEEAISAFKEALSYDEQNGLAYQRLAEAQTAAGELSNAVATYRTLFYKWRGKNWGNSNETDAANWMRFALVLQHLNLRAEALSAYQKGWHYLPTDRGPLPPLFTTPDFASADFESAAYTAMGLHEIAGGVAADAPADFERAIASQPALATPYFYRGLKLKGQPGRAADAVAAFARAEQLGGPEVKPFVDKERKEGSGEFLEAVRKAQAASTP